MRVNTLIGEIGVSANGRDFLFRPSLYAMGKLDDPVKTFCDIYNSDSSKSIERARFLSAVDVLNACCDDDISELTGWMTEGSKGLNWRIGLMPQDKIVILASSLIKHGLIGAVEREKKPDENATYSSKFDPREIASMAVAHLGFSEEQAWNMTVTGFILAMQAKFPDPKKEDEKRANVALNKYDKLKEKMKRINAARDALKKR